MTDQVHIVVRCTDLRTQIGDPHAFGRVVRIGELRHADRITASLKLSFGIGVPAVLRRFLPTMHDNDPLLSVVHKATSSHRFLLRPASYVLSSLSTCTAFTIASILCESCCPFVSMPPAISMP